MTNIPINKPFTDSNEEALVLDAVKTGHGEHRNKYLDRFEKEFASFTGAALAHCTSSCTGAIHLALAAMGVGPGDEVIVPEITWIASVEPVLYLGAKPVFVDVLPDSWCIDPKSVEQAISPKTKAIIAVHVYGNLCDMETLLQIAEKHHIAVLEDAAEGIGSYRKGKHAGSMGTAGTFSFHGTKTISTGEGGMVIASDPEFMHKIRVLNDHGRDPKDPEAKMYWMRNYGFKYRMSNTQAALGVAQLSKISELVQKKRDIFLAYQQELNNLPLHWNPEEEGDQNGYWLPTFVVDSKHSFNREKLFQAMNANNIEARPFFYPLSSLPMFQSRPENRVAYGIFDRGVNLPSFHEICPNEIDRVCQTIRNFFHG
jgi:perosamine synthetase